MSDDKKKKESTSHRQESQASQAQAEDEFRDETMDEEHLFEEAEFDTEGWGIPRDPESLGRLFKSFEGLLSGKKKRTAPGSEESASSGEASGSAGSSERIRARLSELKLPREAVTFILSQVDTTKREVLRIASNEVRLFLENADLGGEIAKILTTLSFEVRMEVRFIPNDQALKPSARGRMKLKRNRPDKSTKSAPADTAQEEDHDQSEPDAPMNMHSEFERDEPGKSRLWPLRRRGAKDESPKKAAQDAPDDDGDELG